MNGENNLSNGPFIPNKITVVLGAQWGDEGKGKVVDMLARDADLVCRCQVNRFFRNSTNYSKARVRND